MQVITSLGSGMHEAATCNNHVEGSAYSFDNRISNLVPHSLSVLISRARTASRGSLRATSACRYKQKDMQSMRRAFLCDCRKQG